MNIKQNVHNSSFLPCNIFLQIFLATSEQLESIPRTFSYTVPTFKGLFTANRWAQYIFKGAIHNNHIARQVYTETDTNIDKGKWKR